MTNFIFTNAHFKTIFANAQMAHLVLPTHKPTLQKTKRAIFCHRTYDDNATIKLNLADRNNLKY